MGQRFVKNTLELRNGPDPIERRENLAKEILNNSTPFPKTIEYKDIDETFNEWVKSKLRIECEGKELPTIALFSQQRFSEYMQNWMFSDDKKNMLLNFKTITRENNPKYGTMYGDTHNIPGERFYTMDTELCFDESGKRYIKCYKMRQPTQIDFTYSVTVMTNKYQLLNDFNMLVNKEFRAIDTYLRVNGHYISMKLENISDESEYSIDDRQFFSQAYSITCRGYIITEDDFIVEERPYPKFTCFEGESSPKKYNVEIEEEDPCKQKDSPYYYKPLTLSIYISPEGCSSASFRMDEDFQIETFETNNIRCYKIKINENIVNLHEGLIIKANDEVKVVRIQKIEHFSDASLICKGFNPNQVYSELDDFHESELDDENFGTDYIID